VPRLGTDAATIRAVRPEEAEALHVRVQPIRQPAEDSITRVFGRHQLHDIASRHAGRIDHVHVAAPMMAAAAGNGGPAEDGVDRLRIGELPALELAPLAVVQRTLARPLGVPDRELRVEVAKAGAGRQVDAVTLGRVAHRQERGSGLVVQSAARLRQLHDVRARTSGQLELVHPGSLAGNSGSMAKNVVKKTDIARVRVLLLQHEYHVALM